MNCLMMSDLRKIFGVGEGGLEGGCASYCLRIEIRLGIRCADYAEIKKVSIALLYNYNSKNEKVVLYAYRL